MSKEVTWFHIVVETTTNLLKKNTLKKTTCTDAKKTTTKNKEKKLTSFLIAVNTTQLFRSHARRPLSVTWPAPSTTFGFNAKQLLARSCQFPHQLLAQLSV